MNIAINIAEGDAPEFTGDAAVYLRRLLAAVASVTPDISLTGLGRGAKRFPGWAAAEEGGGGWRGLLGGGAESAARAVGAEVILSSLSEPSGASRIPELLFCLDTRLFEGDDALRPGTARMRALRKAAQRAVRVVVASEHMRRTLLEQLEVPLDRVAVVPPGTEAAFDHANESLAEAPYYLAAGSVGPGAGFEHILEACEELRNDFEATIVLVGGATDDEPDVSHAGVLRVESCSAPHLAGLYQNAELVFLLGTNRGVPLRVLEAMRAGAPMVAPQDGTITEYAGKAPIFYNADAYLRETLYNTHRFYNLHSAEAYLRGGMANTYYFYGY